MSSCSAGITLRTLAKCQLTAIDDSNSHLTSSLFSTHPYHNAYAAAPAEMLSTLTFLKDFIDTDELSDDSGPDPFLYGVAILKLYTDRPKKSKSAHGEISNGEAEDKATHTDSAHVVLSDLLSEVGDTDKQNDTNQDLAHDVGTVVTEEKSTHQIVK